MDLNSQQPDGQPSPQYQSGPQLDANQAASSQPTPQVFGPQQSAPTYQGQATPTQPSQPAPAPGSFMSQPAPGGMSPNPQLAQQVQPQVQQQSPFGSPQPVSPTMGVPGIGMPYQPLPQNKNRKPMVLASVIGLAVLLVGSSAAAYFGYLVPNKPENLWATALKRTGDGYDKLVGYADQNKDAKSAKYKGTLKLSGSFATDGTIEGESDAKNAVFKGDIGLVTSRLNVEARAVDAANSESPDLYIKATGLKGVDSLVGTGNLLGSFENQWVVVDHTLFDTVQKTALDQGGLTGITGDGQLTPEELTQVAKAVGEINKQYVFTTDESKAVLRMAKNVGKEKQDDRDVYHYVVGLNKQHTKDYLNALATRLDSAPIKKMFGGKSVKEAVQLDELLKEVDKYSDSDTADVWVDSKMKLVRTVRFTDKKTPTDYIELGLHYTGGDSIPFVLNVHTEENGQTDVAHASITVNTKTNAADLAFDFDAVMDSESKQRESGKGTLTITPSKDAIKVDKPASARSLQELIAPLYGGFLGSSSPSSSNLPLGKIEI